MSRAREACRPAHYKFWRNPRREGVTFHTDVSEITFTRVPLNCMFESKERLGRGSVLRPGVHRVQSLRAALSSCNSK